MRLKWILWFTILIIGVKCRRKGNRGGINWDQRPGMGAAPGWGDEEETAKPDDDPTESPTTQIVPTTTGTTTSTATTTTTTQSTTVKSTTTFQPPTESNMPIAETKPPVEYQRVDGNNVEDPNVQIPPPMEPQPVDYPQPHDPAFDSLQPIDSLPPLEPLPPHPAEFPQPVDSQQPSMAVGEHPVDSPPIPLPTTAAPVVEEELGEWDWVEGEPERDDVATIPPGLDSEENNLTMLWIDATYKAEDYGMNVSQLIECIPWLEYWTVEKGNDTSTSNSTEAAGFEKMEFEVINDGDRLEELGLDQYLLDEHESVGILFKEICGNHARQLWFSTPEEAHQVGLNEKSPICNPFKVELQPNAETLTQLALELNEMILNATTIAAQMEKEKEKGVNGADGQVLDMFDAQPEAATTSPLAHRVLLRLRRSSSANSSPKKPSTESAATQTDAEKSADPPTDDKSTTPPAVEVQPDQDWLEDLAVGSSQEILSVSKQLVDRAETENVTLPMDMAWVQIDATDETNPLLYVLSEQAARALRLKIPKHSFNRYEKVVLHLPGVCADYVPTAVDSFNASDFEGIEIEGPIGVNITALELAGVNLTELAETLRNDTEVDEILTRTFGDTRTLGGSYIIPVLQKNQYDAFSAPIVFQGSAVVVRFGIYIESMSNFQTTTMDYDMDIYLIMAWRDARLVNPYNKPILVKEEDILERIWRPDPFFANAKEAEFHEVTFLNFLMRIFSDGIVLYETRIKLKPACNLVLCKYPHDKQTCELLIKSFAYPVETVRFEWFTRKIDAIDKNPDVKLPELYIDRYEPTLCNKTRKSGEFSCLRALFRLKRDVGFHIAQTYIPTSLALMFSWVGVWLPEEFMEGRIGVAITVLLTLSTESAGAREHLPSVSYLKAIDLWFGYITGFVFFTLLQTLFVIGFDKRANQLRKNANKKRSDLTQEYKDALMHKADRYHKTGRYLDNFCRAFYPLSFLLFLIMYYFVFTEGRQDDCISQRSH